jgi:predicted SAM-dependent methyltransferase
LGCGNSHITGAVNVDINPDLKPDKIYDIRDPLPFEDNSFEEVYLFHTIEHIEKKYHLNIFKEIYRVLKSCGLFYMSYPEFKIIAQNWINNKDNNRDFWEATIYGRQLYPSDYHVCILDKSSLYETLKIIGYKNIIFKPEKFEPYNTVMIAEKGKPQKSYELVLYEEIFI